MPLAGGGAGQYAAGINVEAQAGMGRQYSPPLCQC
jgi:hypothetical protein